MKNVLIFVLLVLVLVLGFFLYKQRNVGFIKVGPPAPKLVRAPGQQHNRHDKNGALVVTHECDIIINNDTCVLPISYLRRMAQPGQDTYAYEVRHDDKIIWFGDAGESLDVQPLKPVACSNSTPPPPGTTSLTDTISPPAVLQIGHVRGDPGNDDSAHDFYCFKTTVNVTVGVPPNTTTTPIDPHIFNAGQ